MARQQSPEGRQPPKDGKSASKLSHMVPGSKNSDGTKQPAVSRRRNSRGLTPIKGIHEAERRSAAQLQSDMEPTDVAAEGAQVYVISRKDAEELETPVFQAGQDGSEEAVALFTTRDRALEYVHGAGWTETEEVSELPINDLGQWLREAIDEGIQYLAVDPSFERQRNNTDQAVLALQEAAEDSLDGLLEEITELARSQPPSRAAK